MFFVIILILTLLSSCDSQEDSKIRISDINMFITEEYLSEDRYNEEVEWWKREAGVLAKDLFPEYDEIEYDYSDINFYIYAYMGLFNYPDASFVLELKFDNAEKYAEAKADIHTIYKFLENPVNLEMPACEYTVGNYLVRILTEGEQYDNFPHYVYTICENDDECILRYMFLYSSEQDAINVKDFIYDIENGTNCEWQ